MKTKKRFNQTAMALVAIITLSLTAIACKDAETSTPVPKTYTITLKDGALVFVVEYKALPTEEPAYLAYLKTRLGVMANSNYSDEIDAVSYLMGKGSRFTIKVEDTGSSYAGMNWDTALQSFKIHKDWISTASDTDLSISIMTNAFNSVV